MATLAPFFQANPGRSVRLQPNLPDRGSVFDYVVDLKQPGCGGSDVDGMETTWLIDDYLGL